MSDSKTDLPFWLRPISRRNVLRLGGATVVGGVGGAGYMFRWEPENIEVTHRRITLVPGAGGGKVIRAIQLSDLHASPSVSLEYLARAVRAAAEMKPDVFLLTGDYITSKNWDKAGLIEALKPLAGTAPVYAILGNHDGGTWAGSTYGHPTSDEVQSVLAAAGIDLLLNDVRRLDFGGAPLVLVGLGDFWNDDFLPLQAFHKLMKLDWQATPGNGADGTRPPIVLLSHNPDSKEDVRSYPWDLMLCGHTHGGQLVVPFFNIRPFLPVNDKRFTEGLYPWEGRQIHISRGLGNLHGARFNCRPEISRLDLVIG